MLPRVGLGACVRPVACRVPGLPGHVDGGAAEPEAQPRETGASDVRVVPGPMSVRGRAGGHGALLLGQDHR